MNEKWTKYEWASNKRAVDTWDEDEFFERIDKRIKKTKFNKKNHRNYA